MDTLPKTRELGCHPGEAIDPADDGQCRTAFPNTAAAFGLMGFGCCAFLAVGACASSACVLLLLCLRLSYLSPFMVTRQLEPRLTHLTN